MTGVVLAGGKSTRMGANKAALRLGGRPLIDGVVEVLRSLFPEVLIIANAPGLYDYLGLPVFPDRIPDRGSLGGLYTGLTYASHPAAFFAACDMPFLNAGLIASLRDAAPGYDAVVPRTPEGLQPLHAVYGKACLPVMEALIAAGRLKIDRLFPRVRTRVIEEAELRRLDPGLDSFLNCNTPAEFAAAADRLRQRSTPGRCAS